MARKHALRKSEQPLAELEQQALRLEQQLDRIAVKCREVLDYMEAIEQQRQRLPSAADFDEWASAAREVADAYDNVR